MINARLQVNTMTRRPARDAFTVAYRMLGPAASLCVAARPTGLHFSISISASGGVAVVVIAISFLGSPELAALIAFW